ncbi:hypothetical protein CCACVL1_24213 [Corchorus capsularis]|uniref:Uncharacterized protein n=1 Tax=Corchorus capsularis TaxID=210143 RepID=A0A1R3GQU8_COCAP|nr:hypothetical protein CCACVL1_24213 [Corchorus capsularis]
MVRGYEEGRDQKYRPPMAPLPLPAHTRAGLKA